MAKKDTTLVICRTCRHSVVRTTGISFTADGHKPFMCDCAAGAAVDRYGNEIGMILDKQHPCKSYKEAAQD